jgi:hypothetical protein
VLAAVAYAACSTGDAPERALEDTARAYLAGMAAERPEDDRAAMARIMPTADDLDALVPGRRDVLRAVWGPEAERLVADAPARAHEVREVLPIVAVRTIDFRQGAPLLLARSLSPCRPIPLSAASDRAASASRVPDAAH